MTDFRKYIRPGVITLRQEFRLPGGVLGRLTTGNFTGNRMGVDAALRSVCRGNVNSNRGIRSSNTTSSYAAACSVSGRLRKASITAANPRYVPRYIFNHFTVHLFCYDLKAVSGGIRYELVLLKKKGGR